MYGFGCHFTCTLSFKPQAQPVFNDQQAKIIEITTMIIIAVHTNYYWFDLDDSKGKIRTIKCNSLVDGLENVSVR